MKYSIAMLFGALLCCIPIGCIKSDSISSSAPFEESELESILGITVDMSGSYNERFETTAYPMLTQICDSYFKETMGSEGSKLVISQLSGKTDQIILFEGRPADLRKRFKSAQELAAHLREKADPSASRVSETMCRSLDYIGSVSGRTKKTKVMAIVFSDMCETENDPAKLGALEDALMVSLKKHQSRGGAIGLYFVAEHERERWYQRLRDAGFDTSHYVIEGELASNPQLPRFD